MFVLKNDRTSHKVSFSDAFRDRLASMCNAFEGNCDKCLLGPKHTNYNDNCKSFMIFFPMAAMETVDKWFEKYNK